VARTRMKVLMSTIRPNMKFTEAARMAMRTKNTKNRDHGFPLQQREKAQSGRRSGDGLVWSARNPGHSGLSGGLSIPETKPEGPSGG